MDWNSLAGIALTDAVATMLVFVFFSNEKRTNRNRRRN